MLTSLFCVQCILTVFMLLPVVQVLRHFFLVHLCSCNYLQYMPVMKLSSFKACCHVWHNEHAYIMTHSWWLPRLPFRECAREHCTISSMLELWSPMDFEYIKLRTLFQFLSWKPVIHFFMLLDFCHWKCSLPLPACWMENNLTTFLLFSERGGESWFGVHLCRFSCFFS